MFWLILKFILVLYILLHVGEWLVKVLSRLAQSLQVSSFLFAFLIMALATSVPELIISFTSAINKTPQLAVGVLLGTVVASALVLGSDVIISRKPIFIEKSIARRDVLLVVLIAFLPVLLLFDGVLSRFEGAILLTAFLLFSYHLFWSKKRFLKSFRHHHPSEEVPQPVDLTSIVRPFRILKYSIFLAFSTTLPELVFEAKAIKIARQELAIGDLMGTIVVNSGLIFGLTALIYPIQLADPLKFLIISAYLFLFLLLLVLFIKRPFPHWLGYLLIFSYIIFLVIEFYG